MDNRNIFKIFLFCILFFCYGCNSVNQDISTSTIVEKYSNIYIEISSTDTNTDNHDISAILQTVTVDLIKKPSETWNDVNRRKNVYIESIKSNNISYVYTLMASSNEIEIANGFCGEIIYYYSITQPEYAFFSGNFLSEAATRFIVNMNDYEYDYEKIKNIQNDR